MPNEATQRIVVTTMGTAQDLSSNDLRTYLLNGVLWQLGEEATIPEHGYDVEIIGRWNPSPFGFGTHRKGVQVQEVKDGWPDHLNPSQCTSYRASRARSADEPDRFFSAAICLLERRLDLRRVPATYDTERSASPSAMTSNGNSTGSMGC